MKYQNPQRSILESVLLLLVFVAILAFMINSYVLEQKVYKEKSLHYELQLIRQGINTFSLVEQRKPNTLVELAVTPCKFPGKTTGKPFVGRLIINDRGEVIDPFGHPYSYDARKGWIASTTKGYTEW